MDSLAASFVLGYHGCDKSVADRLIEGAPFKLSANTYDWLGHGIYFWEANPQRGLDFAEELKKRGKGKIKAPSVIGAVIELGRCLDLTSQTGTRHLNQAYNDLVFAYRTARTPIPKNSSGNMRRDLDCAVIEWIHKARENSGEPPFDTVRGLFVEGSPAFPGSGIHEKNHIQITVRNPECIKGVFRVQPRFLAA